MDKSDYWDNIYRSKSEKELSWFQETPTRSLQLIAELGVQPSESIIDIGGGDSRLVDCLLVKGFKAISVLDISTQALARAKARLGEKSEFVKFIACDITNFNPTDHYKLWHDRAAFHFLTTPNEIQSYLEAANRAIEPGGYLIVSTFSKSGPTKCSGLAISQYSDSDLKELFAKHFTNIKCFEETHETPWGAGQNFVFCGFKKTSA